MCSNGARRSKTFGTGPHLCTRSSGWPRPESLGDLARDCAAVREIPDPPPCLDERVLAHAADGDLRRSIASWANHALRAGQHDAFIARIADRAKLEANLHVGARAAAKAKELDVLNATPTELKSLGHQAQTEARGRVAVMQLIADVLTAVGRDPNCEIDFKAEAMVARVTCITSRPFRANAIAGVRVYSINRDASKR